MSNKSLINIIVEITVLMTNKTLKIKIRVGDLFSRINFNKVDYIIN